MLGNSGVVQENPLEVVVEEEDYLADQSLPQLKIPEMHRLLLVELVPELKLAT